MITELSREATEYGRFARGTFATAGGDQLAPRAVDEPEQRETLVASVLAELGAWELDVRASADEAEAAAALCRSAGYSAVAYPVAERLARPARSGGRRAARRGSRLAGRIGRRPRSALGGGRPRRSTQRRDTAHRPDEPAQGRVRRRTRAGASGPQRRLRRRSGSRAVGLDPARDARSRRRRHARPTLLEREQFGQPLAAFQGVQFQLTDAEVERLGLEELAKYTLWSVATGRPEALEDALALRMAALEAADIVFRVAHQLHGAIGFCDETALSWLSRLSVPLRRLPFGSVGNACRAHLPHRPCHGLTGLFSAPVTE